MRSFSQADWICSYLWVLMRCLNGFILNGKADSQQGIATVMVSENENSFDYIL